MPRDDAAANFGIADVLTVCAPARGRDITGDEQQSKNFPIFLLTVRRLLIVSQRFAI